MKILVTALNITQLDYAVALAEGYVFGTPHRLPNVHAYLFPLTRPGWKTVGAAPLYSDGWGDNVPRFCTGPAGDEIIDREKISVSWRAEPSQGVEGFWVAYMPWQLGEESVQVVGAIRREAAMRAWCLQTLGPEIEIHEVIK